MDPLSIIASVLAVVQASSATVKVLRKARQWWGAPQEIEDLIIEIESLESRLHAIKEINKETKLSFAGQPITETLDQASLIINDVNSILGNCSFRKICPGSKYRYRYIWNRHKEKIQQLTKQLKTITDGLRDDLSVIAVSYAKKSFDTLVRIEACHVSTIVDQENIHDKIICEGSSKSDLRQEDDLSASTSSSELIGSSLSTEIELTNADISPKDRVFLIGSGKQSLAECDLCCSCMCHIRCNFRYLRILETFIGRTNVQYTGSRLGCNEKECKRPPTDPLKITYHLPKYLCQRYVIMKIESTLVNGPAYALRAPRVTAWTNLYWKFANSGDLQAMKNMFAKGKASPFDLNAFSCNALMYPSVVKNLATFEFLLDQGADPDTESVTGRTPADLIVLAVFSKKVEKYHASSINGKSMMTKCFQGLCLSKLQKIVLRIAEGDLGAELKISPASLNIGDSKKRTPLHYAVNCDDLTAVKILLAHQADPNLEDVGGNRPLHFVKSLEICKALLAAGADISAKNLDYQRTALHCLCTYHESVDVLEHLIESGMPIDIKTADDETPLLMAVFHGFTETAKKLIALGADINPVNKSSEDNAIHLAVGQSHCEIIPALLARGADYNALNIRRWNVAHKAALFADTTTLNLLAASNLKELDFSVKDVEGKMPADHIAERVIFSKSEEGVHKAFDSLFKSVAEAAFIACEREKDVMDSKIDPILRNMDLKN